MNERMRKLVRFGIVQPTVQGEKAPVEVNDHLTAFGTRFSRVLDEVRKLQESVEDGAGGSA